MEKLSLNWQRFLLRTYSISKSSAFPSSPLNFFPLQQIIRLAEFILRTLLEKHSFEALRTRRARNIWGETPVLIIASGPSSEQLNFKRISQLQKSGGLRVIAINNFIGSPFEAKIQFDAYVLSDPMHSPRCVKFSSLEREARTRAIWKVLSNAECLVFTPASWGIRNDFGGQNFLGFDDRSLEGWSRNISPIWPRGYKSLTLMKAMSLALFLTKGDVFVGGADQSTFLGARVNAINELRRVPVHAEGTALEGASRPNDDVFPRGMSDLFYDEAHTSYQLRSRFAKTGRVFNLNPTSFIDCFEKTDPLEIFCN